MSSSTDTIRELAQQEYKWGFVTDVTEDRAPKGLNEDIIRFISAKKNEPDFMLQWRLKAYRHWESWKRNRPSRNGPMSNTARSIIRIFHTTPRRSKSRIWRASTNSIRKSATPTTKLGIPL